MKELHVQPAVVVTVTDALPPDAGTDCDVGAMVYVHGVAASCVMVKVCPPAVIVPLRELVALFAATLKATVPLPEPLAPLVIVIHDALLVAVHVHPLPLVTVNDPVAPPETTLVETGESEYVQDAAACVIVNVWPPAVTVPVRAAVVAFAATLKPTVPLPEPLAPLVIVIHDALLVAVQAHPLPLVTLNDPVLPPATTDCEAGESA